VEPLQASQNGVAKPPPNDVNQSNSRTKSLAMTPCSITTTMIWSLQRGKAWICRFDTQWMNLTETLQSLSLWTPCLRSNPTGSIVSRRLQITEVSHGSQRSHRFSADRISTLEVDDRGSPTGNSFPIVTKDPNRPSGSVPLGKTLQHGRIVIPRRIASHIKDSKLISIRRNLHPHYDR
jgi:hypothetical protein